MADWTRKVQPGQTLRGMPAKAYNKFIDAAKDADAARQRRGGAPIPAPTLGPGEVWAKNGVGSNHEAGSIFGLDDLVYTPTINQTAYDNNLLFEAVAPIEDDHKYKWGILAETFPDSDALARIITYGNARTMINVTDTAHTHATFIDSDTAKMESTDDESAAPIVWVESGTGLKEGVVFVRPFVSVGVGIDKYYFNQIPPQTLTGGAVGPGVVTLTTPQTNFKDASNNDVTFSLPAGSWLVMPFQSNLYVDYQVNAAATAISAVNCSLRYYTAAGVNVANHSVWTPLIGAAQYTNRIRETFNSNGTLGFRNFTITADIAKFSIEVQMGLVAPVTSHSIITAAFGQASLPSNPVRVVKLGEIV